MPDLHVPEGAYLHPDREHIAQQAVSVPPGKPINNGEVVRIAIIIIEASRKRKVATRMRIGGILFLHCEFSVRLKMVAILDLHVI